MKKKVLEQKLADCYADKTPRLDPGLAEAARLIAGAQLPRTLGPGAQATRRYILGLLDVAATNGG